MSISSTGKPIGAHVKPPRRVNGFTLVEMIVVLTILGLAASFVLPSLDRGLPHWRLIGAAREFVTLLKFARNQSLASMSPLHVVVDRSRNLYWLDSAEALAAPDWLHGGERKVRVYALPEGVSFGEPGGGIVSVDEQRFRILFFPRGNSSGGEIQLRDKNGRAYRIDVDTVTGRPEIKRTSG